MRKTRQVDIAYCRLVRRLLLAATAVGAAASGGQSPRPPTLPSKRA